MSDVSWELYYHIVWCTKNRESTIVPQVENDLYRYIRGKAGELGCHIIEIGGMEDHVHVLMSICPSTSVSDVVKSLKGASSHHINKQFAGRYPLYWQVGYGIRSVSSTHVKQIGSYVTRQKEHHASGGLHPKYEVSELTPSRI